VYNSFLELMFNPLCNVSEVSRYSGVYQERVENLAEHTFEVMMVAYLISIELNKHGEEINIGSLLEKCLIHDIEEIVTGDVPRTTKYANEEIRDGVRKLGVKAAANLLDLNQYITWCKIYKGKEGSILKIADMLVVAKKCVVEIDLRGNYSFLKVLKNMAELLNFYVEEFPNFPNIDRLSPESQAVVKSLVLSAAKELRDLYKKHEQRAFKYRLFDSCVINEEDQ